jgi:uncharacterized protein (TIGR01319 family)
MDASKLNTVLVTDCGSTTTKALLFEKKKEGWRQTFRGEAPTTVEDPVADVTVGALNAFSELQELSGREFLTKDTGANPFILNSTTAAKGIDLYLSTSSAGGGLQMMVAGIVGQISAESAKRAALGAGAIVLDAISADDGREEHERVKRIRHLRPDIILLTGGVDGGAKSHVIELAEIILAAAPRPRFGETLKLPVIYAGNNAAAQEVADILSKIAQVQCVANVRPDLDRENLGPAREAIHEFFLSHVMSHSPGYGKLLTWTPKPILPTPSAVGNMVQAYALAENKQLLCVDIGGATTDVFSVFKNAEDQAVYNRTVSANYGMSYSIANVLIEAGFQNIARWLPYEMSRFELSDRLRNKMIRPTSIPQTLEDLWLEQAVCREALRLSLDHHRALAVGLGGRQQRRGIADIFSQRESRYQLVNLLQLDLVIGSGGVLSHAPNRLSAALMLMEGFGLQGVTQIYVDSVFMLPHLGVLAGVHDQAAQEILRHDCLINVVHSIVPVFSSKISGQALAAVSINGSERWRVNCGEVKQVKLEPGRHYSLKVEPLSSAVNVGTGPGRALQREIEAGECGLILDGRNRPFIFESEKAAQAAAQRRIYKELGLCQ